ncbi:MAG: DUF721 domain-containing protein [Bacteroidales bacterium]|nr:DUF721 domain-containing protein [Bacteroidales bacterium]
MERKDAEPLSSVIQQYLHAIGADTRIREIRAMQKWDEVVGRVISRDTIDIELRQGVLTVKFKSPLIRNEIFARRSDIIRKMNEAAGENIIKTINIR